MSQPRRELVFDVARQPNGTLQIEYDLTTSIRDSQGRNQDSTEKGTMRTSEGLSEEENRQEIEDGVRGLIAESRIFAALPHPLSIRLRYPTDGGEVDETTISLDDRPANVVPREGPEGTGAAGFPYQITFRVSRLEDGRIAARNKVRHSYHDDLGAQAHDMEYASTIIGTEEEMERGRLERSLYAHVLHGFDSVPRPVSVRVVYEGEGLAPGESSFSVDRFIHEG